MREEKLSIAEEFRSCIAESDFVILIDYRGMNSSQTYALRSRLPDASARMQVVKNSLLKRAFHEAGIEKIGGAISGPLAMIWGQGDPVAAARLLKAFVREHRMPAIKTGVWRGNILSAGDIELLADLPSKTVLHGMMLGLLAAPMARLAGVMRQRLAGLLYVLRAIEEKKAAVERQ